MALKATNRKHWINELEIKTIKSADKKAVPENRQMMPEVPETTAERMEFYESVTKTCLVYNNEIILYRPVELYYHILGILNVIVSNYSTNVSKKSSLSSSILSTTPVLPTRMYWQSRSHGSLERGWDIDKLFQENSKSVLIGPPGGGGEVMLRILGGDVPPGYPNPDPISDQKLSFSTPVFRPDL